MHLFLTPWNGLFSITHQMEFSLATFHHPYGLDVQAIQTPSPLHIPNLADEALWEWNQGCV